MRATSYFVAAASTTGLACGHAHGRLGEAFGCARMTGPEYDEVWRVEVRPAGKVPVPLAKSKVKRWKRATRRTT